MNKVNSEHRCQNLLIEWWNFRIYLRGQHVSHCWIWPSSHGPLRLRHHFIAVTFAQLISSLIVRKYVRPIYHCNIRVLRRQKYFEALLRRSCALPQTLAWVICCRRSLVGYQTSPTRYDSNIWLLIMHAKHALLSNGDLYGLLNLVVCVWHSRILAAFSKDK